MDQGSVILGTVVAILVSTFVGLILWSSNFGSENSLIVSFLVLIVGLHINSWLMDNSRWQQAANVVARLMSYFELNNRSEFIIAIDDVVHSIKSIIDSNNQFHTMVALRYVQDLSSELQGIARGSYECDPEEEIWVTKQLVQCCKESLHAISFQDVDWWESPDGKRYLQYHEMLAVNKVKMIRIFIVNDEEEIRLKDTIDRHVTMGVGTYLIKPGDLDERLCRDFVIYDEKILREAAPIGGTLGKRARITERSHEVLRALEDFDTVLDYVRSSGIGPLGLGEVAEAGEENGLERKDAESI